LQKQNILLIEKNEKVAQGNTSRSAALYRNLFSSKTSQILSTSSISFYESIAADIGLKDLGYFWMFSKDDWNKVDNGLKKLDPEKDQFEILAEDEMPKNLLINKEQSGEFKDIHKIIYGHRCGSLSAIKLTRYYKRHFRDLDGKIQFGAEIGSVNLTEKDKHFPPWKDVKIDSITDSKGKSYEVKWDQSSKEVYVSWGGWTRVGKAYSASEAMSKAEAWLYNK